MITIRYGSDKTHICLSVAGLKPEEGAHTGVITAITALASTMGIYAKANDGQSHTDDGYINVNLRDNRRHRDVMNAMFAGIIAVAKNFPGEVKLL